MKRPTTKALRASCILLVIFFSFCAFALLPQPVRANTLINIGSIPYGIAITPNGEYVYVANSAGTVSVINTTTNTVTATITGFANAYDVAISPNGKYAYVTGGQGLAVVNTTTNTVIKNITLQNDNAVKNLAVTPDGNYVYVADGGYLCVVTTATNTMTQVYSFADVNFGPVNIAITPDGAYVYVTGGDSYVAVISTALSTQTANLTVPSGAIGVAMTPSGDFAYVTCYSGQVSVIKTATNTVTTPITGITSPCCDAVTPNGEYVFVAADGPMTIISTVTNTVVATHTFASYTGSPYVAITPNGKYAYTDGGDNTVWMMSTYVAPSVSIAPVGPVALDAGQSQLFTATPSGGSGTYTGYQWYVNGTSQSDQTTSTYSFTPTLAGSYSITATVTDSLNATSAQSNAATVKAAASLTASIAPVGPLSMNAGQSKQFNSTASGGTSPYSYQWYLNGTAVSDATNSTWIFTPASVGNYTVYLNVTDNVGQNAISLTANVKVNPTISEFQPLFLLPLFMIATLLAVLVLKRKCDDDRIEKQRY